MTLKQDSFMPKEQIQMLELIIEGERPRYMIDAKRLISEVYYWRSIEVAKDETKKALKEAIVEISNKEREYEKVFNEYGTSDKQFQPKKYWEGLVSGLKSSLITLHKHELGGIQK